MFLQQDSLGEEKYRVGRTFFFLRKSVVGHVSYQSLLVDLYIWDITLDFGSLWWLLASPNSCKFLGGQFFLFPFSGEGALFFFAQI